MTRILDRFFVWLTHRRQAKFHRWLKTNRVRMPKPDRTCQRFPEFKPEWWEKSSRLTRRRSE